MARDLQRRPALRVSELPLSHVSLYPGEARTICCPGCQRWQKPSNGGLRCHADGIDSTRMCPESGRRVWFDLDPLEWLAAMNVAVPDAALRRPSPVHRKAGLETPPPVFRLAGSCQPPRS
jgi:hypothetical protein